jgi:hypothetical protein
MKRLCAALVIGLVFSFYCFAQTQTGNASYNAAKAGVTIAHSSMSFNTRVRVTNLRNNKEVIATVNSRIPASDPRIADISREAGDVIGMSWTGYTEVRLEQLVPEPAVAAPVPSVAPPPAPAAPARSPAPTPAPPVIQDSIVETVEVISPPPVQYLVVPSAPSQTCFDSPLFCLAILFLLIIAIMLLTAILVLSIHRVPFWPGPPWYYPVWLRRRLRYLKKHRR